MNMLEHMPGHYFNKNKQSINREDMTEISFTWIRTDQALQEDKQNRSR